MAFCISDYFKSWSKVIDGNILLPIMRRLINEYKTKKICPLMNDVFKAFTLFPLQDLRAVFIGQDPYPDKYLDKPRATGILFGNIKETTEGKLSPSLQVIKESVIDFELPHNNITFDPTLEEWAKQGILLINSALTCEMNKVGSHSLLWRPFISSLLINLSKVHTGIIYVLFGRQAQSFKKYIGKYNIVLEIEHPAYFARRGEKMPNIFIDINRKAMELNGIPFKWYNDGQQEDLKCH